MKKTNYIQTDSKYKYFKQDLITLAIFMSIGFLLLFIGIEEPISLLLIFSFVIFILKIVSAILFKGIINKIIMTIYWIFFSIAIMGLILSVVNIEPKGYKFDSFTIKNDSVGLVTNIEINQNEDKYITKLLKPTIFPVASEEDTDVIYKIDNKKIMYQLYSTNIGLHIFYVSFAYLYFLSILLFFLIMIKVMFFEMISSIIKEKKIKKEK